MARVKDWRAALAAYMAEAAQVRFRYGRHDCALFVAGAVRAMTGVDHARGWRSQYRSKRKGQALLREKGFADHVDMVASLYPEVPPIMGQAGDVAVVDGDNLGIIQGAAIYVLRPEGLGTVPLTAADRAFRV